MTGDNLAWELLKASDQRMAALLGNMRSGILFEDETQKIIIANKFFCDIFHITDTPQSLIGTDHKHFAAAHKHLFEKPEEYIARVADLLKSKTHTTADELCFTDGRIVERDYVPVYTANHFQGNLWIYNDVTAQKNRERASKQQVQKYRNIIANMNLGLMEVDKDDIIVSVNDIFCDISGYAQYELIGRRSTDILKYEANREIIENKVKLRRHGFLDVFQIPILNNRGEERWWLISDAPNHDEEGNIIGTIGIHMDISEQKRMEHELSIARQKAEESSRAKEIFLANMSHEIRTPMTGILGIANLLSKTALSDEQKKFTKLISESANNLLTIVNDVLDVEKIAAGKLDLEYFPFRLEEKVFTTLQSFQFKAEDKDIGLLLKNALPKDLVVVGDPFRLGQILNNLLSNALKFTQHGEICINMDARSDNSDTIVIEFQVQDTGIGIKPERLADIFNPFVQASTDTSRKYGGTGLGLTICKNLVEMQHGKIAVTSKLSEGTTFTFQIPYKKGDESMLPEENIDNLDFRDLESMKILVAEDVELNQFLISHILGSWGCSITIVNNGREALEKLEIENFDIILMDIQMPEMDGIAATKAIRAMHTSDKSLITKKIRTLNAKDRAHIPIIALTANALKGDGQRYLDIGMNGYITKPYTEEKLFQVITQVIKTNDYLKSKIFPGPNHFVPPVPPAEHKLYDLSLIHAIGKNDTEFTHKFIRLFVSNMRESISNMQKAEDERNYEAVARMAHKMKANIDSMGIASLKQTIRILEAVTDGDAETNRYITEVVTTMEQVFEQLQNFEGIAL